MKSYIIMASPREDFNKYVNGEWMAKNTIPDKYSSWGAFRELYDSTQKKVHTLLKDLAKSNPTSHVALLYSQGMNETRLDEEMAKPTRKYLEKINAIEDVNGLIKVSAYLLRNGIKGPFSMYMSEDSKNTDLIYPYLRTSGLHLPDRDYFFLEDKQEIRDKFKTYVCDIFQVASLANKTAAEEHAKNVFKIELQLAEFTRSKVDQRDPELNYNKRSIQDLSEQTGIDFKLFFNRVCVGSDVEITEIIADNIDFYRRVHKMFIAFSIDVWKSYFIFSVLNTAAPYLSSDLCTLKFNFYEKAMSGKKEQRPLWERVVSTVSSSMGEVLGREYVKRHFSAESKAKMMILVKNLLKTIGKRIKQLAWMSEDTKERALLKLKSFKVKIGYPDKWHDYSDLQLSDKVSYFENLITCDTYEFVRSLRKMYRAPEDEWMMHPHEINAYYHQTKNEIVFPAAILQPPFFSVDASDAENYGGIGAVIGHEITHGFDNKGSKFDHNGNLNDWWSEESAANFKEKTQYYQDEYSKFLVNGKPLNGELTLGENLADHGGVKISYHAFLDTFPANEKPKTEEIQRFFKQFAIIFRNLITDEYAEQRRLVDPHSANEWRINGTLANIPEFHGAFDVKEGDAMWRKDPVQIW